MKTVAFIVPSSKQIEHGFQPAQVVARNITSSEELRKLIPEEVACLVVGPMPEAAMLEILYNVRVRYQGLLESADMDLPPPEMMLNPEIYIGYVLALREYLPPEVHKLPDEPLIPDEFSYLGVKCQCGISRPHYSLRFSGPRIIQAAFMQRAKPVCLSAIDKVFDTIHVVGGRSLSEVNERARVAMEAPELGVGGRSVDERAGMAMAVRLINDMPPEVQKILRSALKEVDLQQEKKIVTSIKKPFCQAELVAEIDHDEPIMVPITTEDSRTMMRVCNNQSLPGHVCLLFYKLRDDEDSPLLNREPDFHIVINREIWEVWKSGIEESMLEFETTEGSC